MPKTAEARDETGASPNRAQSREDLTCEVVAEPGLEWDRLTAGFSDVCLEQTAAFASSRFGSTHQMGMLLHEAASTEPIAMALAVVAMLPVIGLGLAYVKFGPLWRRRGSPVRPELLLWMLEALKRELAHKRGLALRIMPPADPGHEQEWADALAAAKFVFHRAVPDGERYLVDLSLSEPEQLKSLGSKWRANLAKAAIGELEIREVSFAEGLPQFMALYREMISRKHFNDRHGVEDLPAIVEAAGSSLGMRLFFAFHRGNPVAGSIIVGVGERVFVPFSASNDKALELRAAYALRWAIIERLRGTEARWLDLGGAEGDQGLRHYKLGNVGKRGSVNKILGEFDFAPTMLAAGAAKAVTLGRELARSSQVKRLAAFLPI